MAKIDGFFARVTARHGDDMQCGSGCSDCCHVRLSVTRAEAEPIRALVAAMAPDRRAALASETSRELGELGELGEVCAALGRDGRCRIYEARPVICRTHGAPIRMTRRSLPVIESCFRNFGSTTPDPDCVLDQTTLSALTLAVDREAGGDGSRIELAELLAELTAIC
ncbi:MAG: YkgJ family cysteine cluster protein [Kofleriaceae bacterium]